MAKPQNFVIITQPRSGSYFFQSLLDSAEDVVCHGEIFKASRIEVRAWHKRQLSLDPSDITRRNKNPCAFVMELRHLNPHKIFGFKAFWPHLLPHDDIIKRIINNAEWKKVFLIRDPLETYASLLRARKTKVWTSIAPSSTHASECANNIKVEFDVRSFEEHIEVHKRFLDRRDALANKQPVSCYNINYADVMSPEKQSEVLDFLGSATKASSLTSTYKKQYAGTLRNAFENWGELQSYLANKDAQELISHHRE